LRRLPTEARRGLFRLAALGGARALGAVLGLLAMLQLAPAAGPSVLGQWSMLLAVQGWALHLAECGLRSVVTAEGASTAGGPRRLLPVYVGTRLLLAGAVSGALLAAASRLAPETLPALALVLTSLVAIALQLDWLALVDDRPVLAGALLLVRPTAWCLLLAFAGAPLELDQLAALFALAWALAALASWPLLPAARGPDGSAPPLTAVRMLRLGLPLALVTLGNQGLLAADLFLVGLVLGAERAGAYYLATSLVVAGLVFANAANQAATARIGAIRSDLPAARAELGRQLRIATGLGLGLALAAAFLGPPLVPRLFGPAFAETEPIFSALLPWLLLQHPSAVLQGALAGARGQRPLLLANLAMAAAFAAALGPALLAGSTIGCALARSFAEIARLVVLVRAARGIFVAAQREAVVGRPAIAT
jgi:O-antigen/teichoic acid export membrane protein